MNIVPKGVTSIIWTLNVTNKGSFYLYVGRVDLEDRYACWRQGFVNGVQWGESAAEAIGKFFIFYYGDLVMKPVDVVV